MPIKGHSFFPDWKSSELFGTEWADKSKGRWWLRIEKKKGWTQGQGRYSSALHSVDFSSMSFSHTIASESSLCHCMASFTALTLLMSIFAQWKPFLSVVNSTQYAHSSNLDKKHQSHGCMVKIMKLSRMRMCDLLKSTTNLIESFKKGVSNKARQDRIGIPFRWSTK